MNPRVAMVAAAVATFACAPQVAVADLYTLTFEWMPQVGPSGSEQVGRLLGPFAISAYATDVIDVSDPSFAGQAGILATPGVRFAVDFYPVQRVDFDVTSISVAFAAGTSGTIGWAGYFGDLQGTYSADADWTWQGDTTGTVTTLTYTPSGGPLSVGAFGIAELAGNGAQLLSVTLDAVMETGLPASAPEPSSAIPCAVAGAAVCFRAMARSRKRRTTVKP